MEVSQKLTRRENVNFKHFILTKRVVFHFNLLSTKIAAVTINRA